MSSVASIEDGATAAAFLPTRRQLAKAAEVGLSEFRLTVGGVQHGELREKDILAAHPPCSRLQTARSSKGPKKGKNGQVWEPKSLNRLLQTHCDTSPDYQEVQENSEHVIYTSSNHDVLSPPRVYAFLIHSATNSQSRTRDYGRSSRRKTMSLPPLPPSFLVHPPQFELARWLPVNALTSDDTFQIVKNGPPNPSLPTVADFEGRNGGKMVEISKSAGRGRWIRVLLDDEMQLGSLRSGRSPTASAILRAYGQDTEPPATWMTR
ncbi:hypothetical protein BKA70DRAFT_1428663 [Coprinopsis sp. MPI-PUGE-AT-0042]|nr:hypothetical protein BKA70DRAFT_1428663 [Coprinopsis sp. MPI-PUGE-AT-0042]